MDSGFDQRAARRRARLVGGTAHSHTELEGIDLEFWQGCSGAERLDATWQMALDAIALKAERMRQDFQDLLTAFGEDSQPPAAAEAHAGRVADREVR
jgi:hypothetical protein